MNLISVLDLSHSIDRKNLFEQINFTIDANNQIGLVGANGTGKSTFLKLLSGALTPQTGEIVYRKGIKLAHVDQFITNQVAAKTVFAAVAAVIPNYVDENSTGYMVECVLNDLHIPETIWQAKMGELSGGELNWCKLACATAADPDFIFLDEPTNHMDGQAIHRFEAFLSSLKCGYLIVSHDRRLLDNCTKKTVFLKHQRLHTFATPLSQAKVLLADQEAALLQRTAVEEKEISRLQESQKQLASWAKTFSNEKFATRARNIGKRIERLEENKTEVAHVKSMRIGFSTEELKVKNSFSLDRFEVCTPDGRNLYKVKDMTIRKSDKVFLLGGNGSGKTTFIREIVAAFNNRHSDPRYASFLFNPQVRLGYYDQELDLAGSHRTILAYLTNAVPTLANDRIKAELIHAGFEFERLNAKVQHLSGGERARLKLLEISLNKPNLLVLDEPTNHIDVEGCEQLEEIVMSTDATCVIVSHDRAFMDKIASRLFLIADGQLREINDISEYYRYLDALPYLSAKAVPAKALVPEQDAIALIEKLERQLALEEGRSARFKSAERIKELRAKIETLYLQI